MLTSTRYSTLADNPMTANPEDWSWQSSRSTANAKNGKLYSSVLRIGCWPNNDQTGWLIYPKLTINSMLTQWENSTRQYWVSNFGWLLNYTIMVWAWMFMRNMHLETQHSKHKMCNTIAYLCGLYIMATSSTEYWIIVNSRCLAVWLQ